MERTAMNSLLAWKNSRSRRPLLVRGARQVGKTWLIKEFASRCYESLAYVSFLNNEELRGIFEGSLKPERIIEALEIYSGTKIEGESTLLVLDEIQECSRALTSLKMFQEERPDIHIVAAGSLLGVALHSGQSYPVGKIDYLNMHPMTFDEYLEGLGQDTLAKALRRGDKDLLMPFSETLSDHLRRYYYVGGMPEAVSEYVQTGSLQAARTVQTRLLTDYEHDFSKYATPELTERIRLIWDSAPSQLARENKKFVYSAVRSGARARGYEEAIKWLVDAGLLLKVNRISKPGLPLSAYEDKDAFKLYLLDVGLLGAACRLDASTLISGNKLFSEFKGALTENYVCQELIATEKVEPRYWSAENSSGEVDFVYDYAGKVAPVEVKAEKNVKAKSLRSFVTRYGLGKGLRLSMGGFDEGEWAVDMPLWSTAMLPDAFSKI